MRCNKFVAMQDLKEFRKEAVWSSHAFLLFTSLRRPAACLKPVQWKLAIWSASQDLFDAICASNPVAEADACHGKLVCMHEVVVVEPSRSWHGRALQSIHCVPFELFELCVHAASSV